MPRKIDKLVVKTTLLLAKDFTPREISKELGINVRQVRYILQKHNFCAKKESSIWEDLLNDARNMSVADLAKKYNYSKRTIYRKLKKNNIKIFRAKDDN